MRYKEYNSNKVLETCLRLFWKKGFKGCSIKDLVAATKVNRFSLYQEFGDKNGLLYHSLKLYKERYCQHHFEILKQNGEPSDLLNAFFLSYFDASRIHPGCYFIHIGTELADTDLKINQLITEYMDELSDAISKMLIRNQYQKEEAQYLAKHLTALYCTSMSFCLIHSKLEREHHIANGISVILNSPYATSIK